MWHIGTPKNKAVVQVGIDHGKGHLTVIGQLMHQKNTHAKDNCITLGLIEGSKDDPDVLEQVTKKLFEHLNEEHKVTVTFPPVTPEESEYPEFTPFDTDVTFVEFPCQYCSRLFETESALNYHIRDTHIEKEQRPNFSNLDHNEKIVFPIYVCSNQNCAFACKTSEALEKHEAQHWQFKITPERVEKPFSHTIGKVTRVQLKDAKQKWMESFLTENVEEEESTE